MLILVKLTYRSVAYYLLIEFSSETADECQNPEFW